MYKRQILFMTSTTLSFLFFLISIFYPIINIKHFAVFSKEISITQTVIILFENGLYFLSCLIFIFSIAFPLFKYVIILFKIFHNNLDWNLKHFTNWSMIDVFVVSLIISIYKINLLSDVEVYFMFYVFIISIISQAYIFKKLFNNIL